jgi:hypothetical protein
MVRIFADSSRATIRFAKESDTNYGVTPSSGNTRQLRFTGSTINTQKGTTTSDEIRSDRMVQDVIETDMRTSGEVNIEASAGSHDDLLEGFSYGSWTRAMTFDQVKGTVLAWTSTSTLTITGGDYSAYFKSGARIRTQGFVNPSNNDYFQLASDATYSTGVTTLTVTTTTSVIEAGTFYSSLFDANDVLVLKSTAIRCGTSGASTFDSNSGNAFAGAISAGQLKVGQKLHIDGLGYETGTVAIATGTVAAGTQIIVNDGETAVTFQFGGTILDGTISVANGGSNTASATNLAAAINALCASGTLKVSAKVAAGTVTLKNLNAVGGSISESGDTGSLVTVTDFSGGDTTAHGIYTVTSVSNDIIGVTPKPPTIANTTIAVTVKGSMLRNPSNTGTDLITPHSFSLETAFTDVNQFFLVKGQRVGTFSYDLSSNAVLKGSFGFQGQGMTRAGATTLGNTGSYSVLGTVNTQIMNSTVDVGSVYMNGSALVTALQSLQVKGTNNLRDQMAIANTFPAGVGAGRIEISGSLVAYFVDGTMWDNFRNHSTVSLGWNLTDGDNNHYEWTLPSVVFDTDTVNPAGRDQDIMENLSFTAKRDPATACTFQVDRFSNISPVAAF